MNLLYFLNSKPVSRFFGTDRGMPIDRYYIEKFLSINSTLISGIVLEIADNSYSKKFGHNVTQSIVMHVEKSGSDSDILVANLETGEGIHDNIVDCFIITQTLLCIYDIKSAIKNALRLIKPGGVLLATVPGITQISRYDMDRWGHYWSFTDLSMRSLFEEFVPPESIDIKTYGNVKTASAFLYGLAHHEIPRKDLMVNDQDYQLLITAKVYKGLND